MLEPQVVADQTGKGLAFSNATKCLFRLLLQSSFLQQEMKLQYDCRSEPIRSTFLAKDFGTPKPPE